MIKDSAPRASVATAHAAPDPPPQVAPIGGADRPAIDDRRREVLCIQSELTHLLRTFGGVGAGTLRLEAFSRILNYRKALADVPADRLAAVSGRQSAWKACTAELNARSASQNGA